jgi:hypothetical protein
VVSCIYGLIHNFETRNSQFVLRLQPEKRDEVVKLDNFERLQKVISRAGISSRRNAEKLV